MSDRGPLRIKLIGGPGFYQFEVLDADSGKQLTNVEVVELHVDVGVVRATLALTDAISVDVTLNSDDVTTRVPVASPLNGPWEAVIIGGDS